MNRIALVSSLLLAAGLPTLQAGEGRPPVDVVLNLRVENDDNVFTTGDGVGVDKQESLKLIGSADLVLDTEQGASYFGLRYSPSYTWYDDRPGDSSDVGHEFDLSLRQKLTPRSNLYVKDTLRVSEEPELVSEDVVFRNNNDYLYNSFNLSYDNQLVPEKTTLRLDGRYAMMSYDTASVADISDYDQVSVGADLLQRVAPHTDVGAQVRYTDLDYEASIRDSQSTQVGGLLTRMINPRLQANLRLGYEYRKADDALEQTAHAPYLDLSTVYLPARDTRVTLGAGYGYDKSPVSFFAQQTRTSVYGSLSQRISPALSLNLNAALFFGTFDRDDATSAFDPATNRDGDENATQLGARLTYQVNVRNSVEASYQYTELDSDVRTADDYDRNRLSLGWKYTL